MGPFSDAELDVLAAEVDRQLAGLDARRQHSFSRGDGLKIMAAEPTVQQQAAIFRATGEQPKTFLKRFKQAAHKDLCQNGGILFEQWQKYRDIASKDLLKITGPILLGLGISTGVLATVAVAVAVYILHLGRDAFCAGED